MTGEGAIGRTRPRWPSLRRQAAASPGTYDSEPLALRAHEIERAVRDRLYGSERRGLLDVRPLEEAPPTAHLGEELIVSSEDHPTHTY